MPACTGKVAPVSLQTRDRNMRQRRCMPGKLHLTQTTWASAKYSWAALSSLQTQTQFSYCQSRYQNSFIWIQKPKPQVSCAAFILKSWLWQGRYPHFGKGRSLAFFLPHRANAEEAHTKQEAGNPLPPLGPKSYSLPAGWSHLVQNGAEESRTSNDMRL